MLRSTLKQIESLKQYMGPDRDIYPDWYIDYLLNPWVDCYIPEITWHYDEIVENQLFAKLIIVKYNIKSDIQIIGGNRKGRQSFILAGDHDHIHLLEINNHSRAFYQDTKIEDLPSCYRTAHWMTFKNEVMVRPPMPRVG